MNTLRTDGDVAAACQKLRAIAALYEGFALVHAQLAVLLGFLPFTLGQDDPARVATSVEHAKLALALEPGDERVHAKAALAFLDAGEFALALRHSLISLDLNPNSVEAMHFRGCILCSTGDPDAALEMQQRAMRLDPLFPTHYYENLMEAHYLKGRYAAALAVLEGWDRPHFHVMGTAAACHAMLGNAKQAADYASRFHAASPEGFRIKDYVGAVMRYHMHEEDRAHWLTGFRRSGVL